MEKPFTILRMREKYRELAIRERAFRNYAGRTAATPRVRPHVDHAGKHDHEHARQDDIHLHEGFQVNSFKETSHSQLFFKLNLWAATEKSGLH